MYGHGRDGKGWVVGPMTAQPLIRHPALPHRPHCPHRPHRHPVPAWAGGDGRYGHVIGNSPTPHQTHRPPCIRPRLRCKNRSKRKYTLFVLLQAKCGALNHCWLRKYIDVCDYVCRYRTCYKYCWRLKGFPSGALLCISKQTLIFLSGKHTCPVLSFRGTLTGPLIEPHTATPFRSPDVSCRELRSRFSVQSWWFRFA